MHRRLSVRVRAHHHIYKCASVSAGSDIIFHTDISPEAVIYPSLSLFIFLLPPPSSPSSLLHAALQSGPQINRVHSVQAHSVTVFNHGPQKSSLENPAHCSYRTGDTNHTQQHFCTAKDTHTHTRMHRGDKLDQS